MTEESTAEEQPAEENEDVEAAEEGQSLSDHLQRNFEKQQETDLPEEQSEKPVEGEIADTGEQDSVTAPEHWKAEDRDMFEKLPEEAKGFVLGRHKEMEADYTRKTQDIADTRKNWERVSQAFSPYRDELKSQGLDEAAAVPLLIQSYTDAQKFLQTFKANPRQAIENLARQHNVDLSQVDMDDDYTDPQVAELRQQNYQLQQRLNGIEQNLTNAERAQINATIEGFKNTKDEQGNLKYPHFDAVRHLMAPLVNQGKSMEEAYNEAMWSHPDARSELLKKEQERLREDERKKQEEMRKKSEAARKAQGTKFPAGSVDSKGADLSDLSLGDHLKANAAKAGVG